MNQPWELGESDRVRRAPAREAWALVGLAGIVIVTVAWWAGALWPLPESTPEWVARARAACFGNTENGLPNAGGWILLLGTPPAMLAALWLVGGEELRAGMRALKARRAGRWLVQAVTLALVVLAGLATMRILQTAGWRIQDTTAAHAAPVPPRLHRVPPPLELTDQHGATVRLGDFHGRPVLVTFAYGRCTTVCPVIVHESLAAQAELTNASPALLIVTLDPWRDTLSRLPHIADAWQLSTDAHVLGADVEAVERVLDAWEVPRSRDPRTGEIAHPSLVYVVDADGMLAFAVTGNREQIVSAVRRVDVQRSR